MELWFVLGHEKPRRVSVVVVSVQTLQKQLLFEQGSSALGAVCQCRALAGLSETAMGNADAV